MKLVVSLAALLVLSACATQPPVRAALHRPPVRKPVVAARQAPKITPAAPAGTAGQLPAAVAAVEPPAAVPPVVPAIPAAAPQAGSTVPMLGFRPMRGQTGA